MELIKHSGSSALWARTRKYRSFFRIRLQNGMQYRAAALGGIVTQYFWGFMELMIYSAFYKSAAPGQFPMEMQALSSYIWLQQVFLTMLYPWSNDGELLDMISSGNVAYELCRPVSLYSLWFARDMAKRLSGAALRCLPVLAVALLLPAPYGLALPADPGVLCLFLASLLPAFLLVVAFGMLIYISCFYTVSPLGIRMMAGAAAELLSGKIVPLPFLPEGLRPIVELLPFASMQNMPLRIYGGDIAGADAVWGILLQLLWLLVCLLLGAFLMRRALARTVVQGG